MPFGALLLHTQSLKLPSIISSGSSSDPGGGGGGGGGGAAWAFSKRTGGLFSETIALSSKDSDQIWYLSGEIPATGVQVPVVCSISGKPEAGFT